MKERLKRLRKKQKTIQLTKNKFLYFHILLIKTAVVQKKKNSVINFHLLPGNAHRLTWSVQPPAAIFGL